jgi:hypothetical protein
METYPTSKAGALLDSLEAGDTMREADETLAKLLEAVEATGMKGSLTLQLNFERKKPGVVLVRPVVSSKVPKEKPNASIRYLTRSGDLVEKDPAQQEFAFQNVTTMPVADAKTS